MVRACRDEARSAGDLTALTQLAPASASEHLRVLRTCGLLRLERDGRFRLYRTDVELLQAVVAFVRALDA